MTNTLSFPSPYITLSLLHSLHPQKHLNGTLQGVIRGALLLFQKESKRETVSTWMALCRTTIVSKGVISGSTTVCFKKSHKERLFLYQNTEFIFNLSKLCHIHRLKTNSKWFCIGVIRRSHILMKELKFGVIWLWAFFKNHGLHRSYKKQFIYWWKNWNSGVIWLSIL
jgi:hypothetical protein